MAVVDAFRSVEADLAARYALWNQWALSSPKAPKGPRLESDVVLDLVAGPLQEAGYDVETKGHVLRIVVLWGVNGIPVKSYEADAKLEHEQGRETVVEVEAGGATANNLWRKDLMEASLMPYVDYLAIAVRNEYTSWDSKNSKVKVNPDFDKITNELDALYESRRLVLPLKGVMVIGY